MEFALINWANFKLKNPNPVCTSKRLIISNQHEKTDLTIMTLGN